MTMEARGMHTPIAALAPVESPLGPGSGGGGEGVAVAVVADVTGEELGVLRDEVVSDAAENAARSELCHQIGIPSPYILYIPVSIVVVLALPRTYEFWKIVGEKYVNVAPDMMVDRH
jgi:hypothetical protein